MDSQTGAPPKVIGISFEACLYFWRMIMSVFPDMDKVLAEQLNRLLHPFAFCRL